MDMVIMNDGGEFCTGWIRRIDESISDMTAYRTAKC